MTKAPEQQSLWVEAEGDPAGPSCPLDPERDIRLRRANRAQLTWGRVDLDAALAQEHPARAIVAVIERLDLRGLYSQVRARGETAGAPPIDPKILLGLWVYATSDGVGSGREIAQLVDLHAAYRWICGGVEVAYLPPAQRLPPRGGGGLRPTRDAGPRSALAARSHRSFSRGSEPEHESLGL